MARLKRKSLILELFRQRLAGLKSMKSKPDFGPTVTVEAYEAQGKAVRDLLDDYNQSLAAIDDKHNQLHAAEQELRSWNSRILAATAAHFGPDSSEYEAVGGTRQSERKRRTTKKKDGG